MEIQVILAVSKWGILTTRNKTGEGSTVCLAPGDTDLAAGPAEDTNQSPWWIDYEPIRMGEELIIKTGELPFCVINILYQHLKCKKK